MGRVPTQHPKVPRTGPSILKMSQTSSTTLSERLPLKHTKARGSVQHALLRQLYTLIYCVTLVVFNTKPVALWSGWVPPKRYNTLLLMVGLAIICNYRLGFCFHPFCPTSHPCTPGKSSNLRRVFQIQIRLRFSELWGYGTRFYRLVSAS